MKRNGNKIAVLLCCLGLVLGLCACSSNEKTIDKDPSSQGSGQASEQASGGQSSQSAGSLKGYTFMAETGNGSIEVGADMNMAQILAVLGEADSYYEAASCAFEGLDKMYTYKHFEIDTYPQGETDLVSAIYLLDDLVATPEGLRIGSTKEQVESIYGAPSSQVGSEYIYEKDGMSLRIQLEDDKVSVILYASSALGQVAQ